MLALAHSTGTVTLHVADAHGKPIANHQVWLESTNSTKAIRPFGVQWGLPSGTLPLTGKTDKNGDVKIRGVRKGAPMTVITKFGPRFDPFVRSKNEGSFSLDVMKFEGAVYAGKPARVLLADDYEFSGRITNVETGAPVPGVTVTLSDTGFGHMSGYPHTDIDETKTDADGKYVFRRLPNCSYIVRAALVGPSLAMESHLDSEDWKFDEIHDEKGKWVEARYQGFTLNKPHRTYDFRTSPTAWLSVVVKRGAAKTLRGWTIWPMSSRKGDSYNLSGAQLDWASPSAPKTPPKDQDLFETTMLPGTYSIILERNSDHAKFTATTIELRSGEHRNVELTLSAVIAMKKGR